MNNLVITRNCTDLTIDKCTDNEGEVIIEIDDHLSDVMYTYLNKPAAAQIVNHLITVFDITPEQRNNQDESRLKNR